MGGSRCLELPARRGRPVTLCDLGQGPFFPPNPAPRLSEECLVPWAVLAGRGRQKARRHQFPLQPPSSSPESTSGSGSAVAAVWGRSGIPAGLPGGSRDGRTTGVLAALLLPPWRSPPVLALAQPPHTGLGRSRLRSLRAPAFRAGPGAPPPKPPKLGCWPQDGTCRSAPTSPPRTPGTREDSAESAPQGFG